MLNHCWPESRLSHRQEETTVSEEISMRKQKGFSLIELLIVVAIILIIAAIAIPNLLRARMSANDSATASTMRTINTSQVTYITTYPSFGYAAALNALSDNSGAVNCATPGAALPTAACLIDNVIGCSAAGPCQKNQYLYMYTPAPPSPTGSIPEYTFFAAPVGWQTTGTRNWCTNSDAVVRNVGPNTTPNSAAAAQGAGLTAANCVAQFNPLQQ
jgi:type IV pilus assembly protein PilA